MTRDSDRDRIANGGRPNADQEQADGRRRRTRDVKRLFEAIANYTYDWETWMGLDGRPRWINPAVERMTGHGVDACLAMPDYPMPLVYDEDQADMARCLRDAAAGSSGNDVAFRIRRKDGQIAWAAMSWQTLLDSAGRPLGYRTSIRDITERKRAEDALRRAHAEAERANLAKSRFLAAASHDLRQPLQATNMFVAALKATTGDPESGEIIAAIQDSLRATNDLLDALLDVSRLDAGVVQVKPRDFAIGDLLERMETEFAAAAGAKGLALRVVASSAAVRSDPALLDRILRNLVSNAVRYTVSGRVLVGCRRRGPHLRIEVRDTGIGIPEEMLDAVFEEFTQLGNPERDRTRGLGLGLAIVDRMARLLKHRVEVRSQPDRGSTFSLEVPLGGPCAAAEPPPSLNLVGLAGAFIVVIDDDPVQLAALAALFRRWGCGVLAAASASDAQGRLGKTARTPDAIVADYRLRGRATGAQAIAAVRAKLGAAVPGLILTGDTEPARLIEARASGFELLHKPVDPDRLRNVLCGLLSAPAAP